MGPCRRPHPPPSRRCPLPRCRGCDGGILPGAPLARCEQPPWAVAEPADPRHGGSLPALRCPHLARRQGGRPSPGDGMRAGDDRAARRLALGWYCRRQRGVRPHPRDCCPAGSRSSRIRGGWTAGHRRPGNYDGVARRHAAGPAPAPVMLRWLSVAGHRCVSGPGCPVRAAASCGFRGPRVRRRPPALRTRPTEDAATIQAAGPQLALVAPTRAVPSSGVKPAHRMPTCSPMAMPE